MNVPSPDAVRSQLAAILASPSFLNAQRSRRFLEFVVQQTLAGAQDSVKESVIAVEVFDRKADFDTRVDAIVRVEASKLRARLQEYYAGDGALSAVLIEIPKGTYVPLFSPRARPVPVVPEAPVGRRFSWKLATVAGVLALAVAGLWFGFGRRVIPGPVPRENPAIAVLPFLNLSPESSNEYFSDGLADQITDALAQVDGLRVASRTSAFSFRSSHLGAAEIGSRLKVSALLEGSVQKSEKRARITLQLIQTRDGYHLWSQTFDRELTNIFEVQDEISKAVTHAMKVSLDDDSRRRLFRRYSRDPDAFDLYLRGRHALDMFSPDSPARASALFAQAVDRDPQFALAYTGMATAAAQGLFSAVQTPAEIRAAVKSAAEKALTIDDTLAEAHGILAGVEGRFDRNWAAAEKRFRRAIELDPRSSSVRLGYAQSLLLPLRRFDEAVAECRVAVELDPFSAQTAFCAPWVHMMQGMAKLALSELRELQANHPGSHNYDGGIQIAQIHAGEEAEMIRTAEVENLPLPRQTPGQLGFLAYAYGRIGRASKVLEIERELKSRHYVPPAALCLVYLGSGRLAEAREAATAQILEHDPNVYYLALDPLFAELRQDPTFAAVLRSTGLPF